MSGEVKTNLVKNHARFGKPIDNGGLNEHFRRKPINYIFWAWSCFTNDGIVAKKPPKTKTKNGEVIPRLAVFTAEDVNHRIARFIVEIRAPNGDFNPQNLCSCLLLGIYDACVSKETPTTMNEKDCDFLRARKTLNAQRKGLAAKCK